MPDSIVTLALNVLANQLTAVEGSGAATNLSALNFVNSDDVPYWRGLNLVGPPAFARFATKQSNPWQRFFEELWEVPVKQLIGSSSTGVVYILPTDTEINGESDINATPRYNRAISVEVIAVWLDEGSSGEYEQLIDALFQDALQDPTLGSNITFFRWISTERLRPRGIGLAGVRLSFLMDYFVAVP